jgi:hypothetical protein
MNPHSATLLRALATLRVAEISFKITRDGDARHHTIPHARLDQGPVAGQRFALLSIADVFEAYALTPRKGTYTLRVADGQLAYAAVPPRAIGRLAPKAARRRHAFVRRPEKLAA